MGALRAGSPCWFLFLLLFLLLFCSSGTEVVTVDVHGAKELINSGYRFLDVRTVEEFEEGHASVKDILNIPYLFSTLEGRVKNPDFLEQVLAACSKEDHLLVGCRSGARSLAAASDLLAAGFKDVKDLGGGHLAWVQNGLEATKPKKDEATKPKEDDEVTKPKNDEATTKPKEDDEL